MAMATSALLILLMAIPAAYAAQYIVGDSSGWTNFGVDYSTWASGKTFTVGDTLVFNYDGSTHKVDEVSQSDYNSCSSSNAIESHDDGSTTIKLSKTGTIYFICPTAGHCSGGMKLAVNVVAASTTPGTSPTTPAPAPPSGSTTPSGSNTPAAETPSNTTSPPPPPGNNGAASVFVNMNVLMFGSLLVLGLLG
ncbi:hypothetical protein JCGZ_14640 [Jatropha curcas]|uniref:Phytocyanin domain-containing protein n=1 Tax=Jatropha curcas TaxID=180498 RepID=A0A067KAM9_JATCU|nr:uclacyanin-2 [Jatropha curcas]KDP28869.1 hypothetical protein JCGZ_14640 [Jatropha curcas]